MNLMMALSGKSGLSTYWVVVCILGIYEKLCYSAVFVDGVGGDRSGSFESGPGSGVIGAD